MKPPPFRYETPGSVEEALERLQEHGPEASLLAGGQSLVPMLNFRLARPEVLVDLNPVAELARLREENGSLRIGAMVRQRDAERSPVVARRAPPLAEALRHVAHPAIRNRGTVGGSVAHADPAAELPAVLLALRARLHLRDADGSRTLRASDFFVGPFATALGPGEMLVEVEVPPLPARAGWGFREMARRHGDYALLGAAAVLVVDEDGICREARLAFVNGGPVPVDASPAVEALLGEKATPEALRAAAAAAAEALDPPEDIHASAAYRRHLAGVLGDRVLREAAERVGASGDPARGGAS